MLDILQLTIGLFSIQLANEGEALHNLLVTPKWKENFVHNNIHTNFSFVPTFPFSFLFPSFPSFLHSLQSPISSLSLPPPQQLHYPSPAPPFQNNIMGVVATPHTRAVLTNSAQYPINNRPRVASLNPWDRVPGGNDALLCPV